MEYKFNILFVTLILSILVNISQSYPDAKRSLRVSTTKGEVEGIRDGDCELFLGIPYAKPPVGELRWKNPEPVDAWSEVLKVDTQPPECVQRCNDTQSACLEKMGEDCLFLNIYRPSNLTTNDDLLPVMFFIHGGNFDTGACRYEIYNAKLLAPAINALVICVNYRLGALGFLYLGTDSLTGENITGNFGLADQGEGLRFIHDNVESFGGDPNRITIAGQSAGAESVAMHYTNPEYSNIFEQAIMYSNPFSYPLKNETDAMTLGYDFAAVLSCTVDRFDCLRNKSADEVAVASTSIRDVMDINSEEILQFFQPWGATTSIPMVRIFENTLITTKPTMMGSLPEEARLFVYMLLHFRLPSIMYEEFIRFGIPDHAEEILQRYPSDGTNDQRDAKSNLGSDYLFSCPTQYVASLLCLQGEAPIYHYIFDHAASFQDMWNEVPQCKGHTCHSGDLPFIFRNAELLNFTYTSEETLMLDEYTTYTKNFIHRGNPNQPTPDVASEPNLTYWPTFKETSGRSSMVFSTDVDKNHVEEDVMLENCQYFDGVGYYNVYRIN